MRKIRELRLSLKTAGAPPCRLGPTGGASGPPRRASCRIPRGALACAALLASAAYAGPARADDSSSMATSNSSDLWGTSSGWFGSYQKERKSYLSYVPTGIWEYQYENSFGGTPTVPGDGWTTWDSLTKPSAADWGTTGLSYANPNPHKDMSASGSLAWNYGYIEPYKGGFLTGNALYVNKGTASYANAKAAVDSPTVAKTRITDPFAISAPSSGDWALALDYSQFGSFAGTDPDSSIFANYSVTVGSTTFNLLSISFTAGGDVSITTDLNGNDASISDSLISGQLNGVLEFDGADVTASQAEADLLSYYNPDTGWNLNPDGYTIDDFEPDLDEANVLDLSATVFLDSSTSSVTVATADGSEAVAEVPEPATAWLMLSGIVGCCLAAARRRFRPTVPL